MSRRKLTLNPHTDPCPCGSGKLIRECCVDAAGELFKLPANTYPAPPITGASLKGCYARTLHDCSDALSLEHYISKNLLQRLANGGYLQAEGFTWQKASRQRIPPATLASNVLCSRHNQVLSSLDAEAGRLFDALCVIQKELSEHDRVASTDRAYLFSGHDIERWMLKVLVGATYSGNLGTADLPPEALVPPVEWLHILFGYEAMPDGWGLYFDGDVGDVKGGREHGIGIAPLIGNHEDPKVRALAGLALELGPHDFLLVMGDRSGDRLLRATYRPKFLTTLHAGVIKNITLSWTGLTDGHGVEMHFSNSDPRKSSSEI